MTSSAGTRRSSLFGLARKASASLAVLAATAGLVGLATFGSFDNATDTVTRSVLPAGAPAR